MSKIELYNEDCLIGMNKIQDKSIDLIFTDLPFGTTSCTWDRQLPLNQLWSQYSRIIKDNGVILLFGTGVFFAELVLSNRQMFKYDLVWEKERPVNIFFMKKKFGIVHEHIAVFYNGTCKYFPKMEKRKFRSIGMFGSEKESKTHKNQVYKYSNDYDKTKTYPRSVLEFNRDCLKEETFHVTQKPIALLEYLIRTYTEENDVVLDSCMGSGSTGVACKKSKRNFIGFEIEKEFFDIAKKRIKNLKFLF